MNISRGKSFEFSQKFKNHVLKKENNKRNQRFMLLGIMFAAKHAFHEKANVDKTSERFPIILNHPVKSSQAKEKSSRYNRRPLKVFRDQ